MNAILSRFLQSPKTHLLLFLLLTALCIHLFHYAQVAKLGPASIHSWRQSDSASQAMWYWQTGMNFFEPGTYQMGLKNCHGKGASEFPILYYLTAASYHVFGAKDVVLRLLNYIILLGGMFCFSRLLFDLLGNVVNAVAITAIFMSSQLMAFYSFNFLPNIPALGLTLMSMYFYFLFYKTQGAKWFWCAVFVTLLAGLIKPTFLIVFAAGVGSWLIVNIFCRKNNASDSQHYFPPFSKTIAGIFVIAVPVIAWILWVGHYNDIHDNGIFPNILRPIWAVNKSAALAIWQDFMHLFKSRFLLHETRLTAFVIFVLNLIFIKKLPVAVRWFYIFIILGTIAYFLLFYTNLDVHDYYMIDFMPLTMFVFLLFFVLLKKQFPKVATHWALTILLLVFANMNIIGGRRLMDKAYRSDYAGMHGFNPAFYKKKELHIFLSSHDISFHKSTIISAPDVTPNLSLYYLNLRGWTKSSEKFTPGEINYLKSMGAEYLVISDTALLNMEAAKPYLNRQVGVFDGEIYVFDMRQ